MDRQPTTARAAKVPAVANTTATGDMATVPDGAVRDARLGGTVALLCAAAISAQTLFQLGRLIGLSPWTAWLLPAALDVYAITSARVAFQVPVGHKARSKAIWNARIALTFTVASNSLFHALYLAKGHTGWTPADWALVVVSALPPIVVERLLHLQSMVNSATVIPAAVANAAPLAPAASANPEVAPAASANPALSPTPTPTANPASANGAANTAVANPARPTTPTRPRPVANPSGDTSTTDSLIAAMEPAYRQLLATTGRRPTAGQLVEAVDGINTESRAKQIRDALEARFPELAPRLRAVS